jgi:hypothetical protein
MAHAAQFMFHEYISTKKKGYTCRVAAANCTIYITPEMMDWAKQLSRVYGVAIWSYPERKGRQEVQC